MTDHHAEEQEMEAEALAAIFDVHFGSFSPNDDDDANLYNHYWFIDIYPEAASDQDELNKLNHVAIKLLARIPKSYPEGDADADADGNGCLPVLEIQLIKGLVADPHQAQLLEIAQQEAQANQGAPSIFAIVERLREWLVEHNRPGLDDVSMHAQMIMRQQEQEKQRAKKAQSAAEAAAKQGVEFESHLKHDEMSAAELEELAVRKRRAEGTPCNKENFEAWKIQFDAEMRALKEQEQAKEDANSGKTSKKKTASASSASGGGGAVAATTPANASTIDRSNRITGFDYFSDKATNLEALEAAAEQAEQDENASISGDEEEDEGNKQDYNEELFEDDVDLDDLDFDDEDDDEDEPNI